MTRYWLGGCWAGFLVLTAASAGDPPAKQPPSSKPPWQRLLQGEDAHKAQQLEMQLGKHWTAVEFAQALKVAEELAALRQAVQGADHWEAQDARWKVKAFQAILKHDAADQKAAAEVPALDREAITLESKGRYQDALPLREQILAVHRKLLTEQHPFTARDYENLARNLSLQAVHAEMFEQGTHGKAEEARRQALELYRKALELRRELLGEEHPTIAACYFEMGRVQIVQGRHAEAEGNLRKALASMRKVYGEEHRNTAAGHHQLALSQQAQGNYAEAEVHLQRALGVVRKELGEDHPASLAAAHDFATIKVAQGKYAEAEETFRRLLDRARSRLGEENAHVANYYRSLGICQGYAGKQVEAEESHRKAIDVSRKVLGDEHPVTTLNYGNLAFVLHGRGKYAEAEESYRMLIDRFRKARGEEHRDVCNSYRNLATTQLLQGKYVEAEGHLRKALALSQKLLGAGQPDTADCDYYLALAVYAQGRFAEAEQRFSDAADTFERTRQQFASSGLERVTATGKRPVHFVLAAVLAGNGKPVLAWQRFEQSLARGTWDDLTQRRHLSAAAAAQRAELLQQLERLDRQIDRALTGKDSPQRKKRLEDLLGQQLKAQGELLALTRQLEQEYGPPAGQVFNRADTQKALPADAALLGWVDHGSPTTASPIRANWAVLLRARGEPIWVRVPGTGPDGAWTEADERLPDELRQAIQKPQGDWRKLADRLREQRLAPLAKYLAAHDGLPAVRHLIVLPSPRLDGVPLDVLAEGYTVSHAPSGTIFAHLQQQKRPTSAGLLVLADPVFDKARSEKAQAKLPPGGILIELVTPGSSAAQAQLKAGDVLLRYADSDVNGVDDLTKAITAHAQDKEVQLSVWRDGATWIKLAPPGKLGVVLAKDPAPKVLAERRQFEQQLALARSADDGGDWQPLPGTRVEAEALRRLFAGRKHDVRLLADSQASEQALDALRGQGELGKYRYLHLATHGTLGGRLPLSSAVILSRDNLPDPQKQLDAGLPLYDGKLTAAEVLRDWHLNAELVTLSACETALGKYELGESFVGFPQALLLSGARSVCVSLWPVHDTATALLMTRFYQNLLGAREDLQGPLPKARALGEAKAWLRNLTRAEALQLAARALDGVERAKGRPALPPGPDVPKATASDAEARPFAHPYYWSAFVLIGDPN